MHKVVASISAYVDDKVIRSPSWEHLGIRLDRPVHSDRFAGQFLNFHKYIGLRTYKEGAAKLRALKVEGNPLQIVKDAKSLGALVSMAMHPKNFVANKRVENALQSL